MSEPCPSCDHDLSHPGAPGHECYTYAEWRARQAAREQALRDLVPKGGYQEGDF